VFHEADCMNATARYRLCIRIVGTSAKPHAINPNNMKLGRETKLFHRERSALAMLIFKEIAESMKLENPAQDVPIPFSFRVLCPVSRAVRMSSRSTFCEFGLFWAILFSFKADLPRPDKSIDNLEESELTASPAPMPGLTCNAQVSRQI